MALAVSEMLRGLQPRLRREPHLPVMVKIVAFPAGNIAKNHVVDSRSQLLGDFGFALDIINVNESLGLQDFQAFKNRVKPAIDTGNSVIDIRFHGASFTSYRM
jgi:hypothetical protein